MRQVVQADEHDTRCGSGTGTVQQAGVAIQRPETCTRSWIVGSVASTADTFFSGLVAEAALLRI